MAKKIVRITESDLVNIVKRVINEVGGHDDFFPQHLFLAD